MVLDRNDKLGKISSHHKGKECGRKMRKNFGEITLHNTANGKGARSEGRLKL
jgi:hypothetical protein